MNFDITAHSETRILKDTNIVKKKISQTSLLSLPLPNQQQEERYCIFQTI